MEHTSLVTGVEIPETDRGQYSKQKNTLTLITIMAHTDASELLSAHRLHEVANFIAAQSAQLHAQADDDDNEFVSQELALQLHFHIFLRY